MKWKLHLHSLHTSRSAPVAINPLHLAQGTSRVFCKLILASGEAAACLARAMDLGAAACCSEAAGVMKAALHMTVEYLKTREQFGVTIGTFQAHSGSEGTCALFSLYLRGCVGSEAAAFAEYI